MKNVVYVLIGIGSPRDVVTALRVRLGPYAEKKAALMLASHTGYNDYVTAWAEVNDMPVMFCDARALALDALSGLRAIGYEVSAEVVSPGDGERATAKRLEQAGIRVTVTEVG